jgi:hypothetical protein
MTLKDIKPDRPINQPMDTAVPRVEKGLVDNFVIVPKTYYAVRGDTEKRKLPDDNEQPNQPAL